MYIVLMYRPRLGHQFSFLVLHCLISNIYKYSFVLPCVISFSVQRGSLLRCVLQCVICYFFFSPFVTPKNLLNLLFTIVRRLINRYVSHVVSCTRRFQIIRPREWLSYDENGETYSRKEINIKFYRVLSSHKLILAF